MYEKLLNDMQQEQGVALSDYMSGEYQLRILPIEKKVRPVITSAFKLYIGLGDLHRYKETILETRDHSCSRK